MKIKSLLLIIFFLIFLNFLFGKDDMPQMLYNDIKQIYDEKEI